MVGRFRLQTIFNAAPAASKNTGLFKRDQKGILNKELKTSCQAGKELVLNSTKNLPLPLIFLFSNLGISWQIYLLWINLLQAHLKRVFSIMHQLNF